MLEPLHQQGRHPVAETRRAPALLYHPERFRAYRDYAGNLGAFYQAQVEPERGMLTLEQLNDMTRPVMEEMNRRGMAFPRKLKDDLQLEPGWPIDGAYVEYRGPAGDIRFTVTAVPRDHHLSRLWYLLPEVLYSQELVGDFRLMDLATATDMALSDDQAELHKRIGKAGGDITEGLRQAFEQDGEAFPDGLRIEDISPRLAGERLATCLRHVATHWRRGHWRRQAFGPARSLRKLIWVMPVKVGSRDTADGDTGHLYLVS
jgi:hypothetical protein